MSDSPRYSIDANVLQATIDLISEMPLKHAISVYQAIQSDIRVIEEEKDVENPAT